MKLKYTINKYILAGKYMDGSAYFEEFATTAERAEALRDIKRIYVKHILRGDIHASRVVQAHGLLVSKEIIVA
jgi:hypothetical protein